MPTIQDQIKQQKKQKSEKLKDIFYVDYCYHCKDNDLKTNEYVTCHHPWYCHHDDADVQELESQIGGINYKVWMRGYMCGYEYNKLKELQDQKWELIKKCRREMPRVKV